MYYYGARFYDPSLGRFLVPDTIVPDPYDLRAMNRYVYVYGNPIIYTDPTGHLPVFNHTTGQRIDDPQNNIIPGSGPIQPGYEPSQLAKEIDAFVEGAMEGFSGLDGYGDPNGTSNNLGNITGTVGGGLSGLRHVVMHLFSGLFKRFTKESIEEAAEEAGPLIGRSLGAAANIRVNSRIGENPYAIRLAEKLNEAAQRDVDSLLNALREGNRNPGIGTRNLGDQFFELRGRNAGRVIIKQRSASSFDIVGKFVGHARGDKANSEIIQRLITDYGNLPAP